MKLSQYLLPLLKEDPAEASIASHRLMLRAGMIRQLSSGIYDWLPLGLKVLRKIEKVVRDEMDKSGALEVLMPTMQPASLWEESGRGSYGKETLKVRDRHDIDMIYGPTNEEVITDLFRRTVKSYKQLPLNLYQIQWKFRDEIRPRFGVMRGREFLMKDAYTFSLDEDSHVEMYNQMYHTYLRIFNRLGLKVIPVRAETGMIGGKLSHEFQVLADTGESEIFYDERFEELLAQEDWDVEAMQELYAAADELHDPAQCDVPEGKLKTRRGIEVGHIFYFGDKYSAPMKASVTDPGGMSKPVKMGAHGIGISRLVGAIIEANHDVDGIRWPRAVAPFDLGLIHMKPGHDACDPVATTLYQDIQRAGYEVLMDDRKDVSAGQKFATQDLIGTPIQLVVGPRGVEAGEVEVKFRASGAKENVPLDGMIAFLSKKQSLSDF